MQKKGQLKGLLLLLHRPVRILQLGDKHILHFHHRLLDALPNFFQDTLLLLLCSFGRYGVFNVSYGQKLTWTIFQEMFSFFVVAQRYFISSLDG